jgi:bifunctional non-homologous end joining protein LigD
VAAPITWAELDEVASPARYTIRDGEQLVERARSRALAKWGMADQALPEL